MPTEVRICILCRLSSSRSFLKMIVLLLYHRNEYRSNVNNLFRDSRLNMALHCLTYFKLLMIRLFIILDNFTSSSEQCNSLTYMSDN